MCKKKDILITISLKILYLAFIRQKINSVLHLIYIQFSAVLLESSYKLGDNIDPPDLGSLTLNIMLNSFVIIFFY